MWFTGAPEDGRVKAETGYQEGATRGDIDCVGGNTAADKDTQTAETRPRRQCPCVALSGDIAAAGLGGRRVVCNRVLSC